METITFSERQTFWQHGFLFLKTNVNVWDMEKVIYKGQAPWGSGQRDQVSGLVKCLISDFSFRHSQENLTQAV